MALGRLVKWQLGRKRMGAGLVWQPEFQESEQLQDILEFVPTGLNYVPDVGGIKSNPWVFSFCYRVDVMLLTEIKEVGVVSRGVL